MSFKQLRAEGAFVISAKIESGLVNYVQVHSEKGGIIKLKNPFENQSFTCDADYKQDGDILLIPTKEGQDVKFEISKKQ